MNMISILMQASNVMQPAMADSLTPDSSIIETDSTFQIPNPTDYSISEIFVYVKDFLNVTLFEIQDTPVTFMSLLVFLLFIVGFSLLASFLKRFLNKNTLKTNQNPSKKQIQINQVRSVI